MDMKKIPFIKINHQYYYKWKLIMGNIEIVRIHWFIETEIGKNVENEIFSKSFRHSEIIYVHIFMDLRDLPIWPIPIIIGTKQVLLILFTIVRNFILNKMILYARTHQMIFILNWIREILSKKLILTVFCCSNGKMVLKSPFIIFLKLNRTFTLILNHVELIK